MLATLWAIIAMLAGDAPRTLELSCQAWGDLPETNLVWRSVVTRNLGNVHLLTGQAAAAHQALTEAMRMSQRADNIYMTMVIMYELAELQIVRGRLHHAAQICHDALQLAAERGTPGLAMPGALHVGLAEVLREWNDLEAGRREALAGIEYGQQGRSLGVQVCGYTRLGMLAQARGDAKGAAQAFQKAVQLASTRRRTSFLPHHDVQARLWWRQGDVDAAWRWTQARGLSADDELSYMNETAHLTLARVLLAQNRLDEAVRLLTRLRSAAEAAGRMGRVIEILAVLALALQARGETGQALAVLEQALALAEPEGYVRVFVDEGEAMREVIRHWGLEIRRQKRNGGEAKLNRLLVYADKLLAAFPDRTPQLPITNYQSPTSTLQSLPLLEPLSEREIEILRFIAAGMSNQEIAQRLVVALSTIQWHIKNVYGKLNVHSRTQAVARARELGLLT
jgi:LuxR family maltose regulon positive regulatory protein